MGQWTIVTPIAFSNPYRDRLEVMVRNDRRDWSVLTPATHYQPVEVVKSWVRDERKRMELTWYFKDSGESATDDDLESLQEFLLLKASSYHLIANENRSEMPLDQVVSFLTFRLGLRKHPEKPRNMRERNGLFYFQRSLRPYA